MKISGMIVRGLLLMSCVFIFKGESQAQDFEKKYAEFKKKAESEYGSFRQECNQKYIEFLRKSWDKFEGKEPIPMPKDEDDVAPLPYVEEDKADVEPIETEPIIEVIEIEPIDETPQPKPIEPIREVPAPEDNLVKIPFYGIEGSVRLPDAAKIRLRECSPGSIADAWAVLSNDGLNNAIRDCLETRIRHNLCDWAYLTYLDRVGKQYCDDANAATLLTAFLYCQSGYQMRLANDSGQLVLLYGTKHQQYDKSYFYLNGLNFYPFGRHISNSMMICNAPFTGETPMTLRIDEEQLLGSGMTEARQIKAARYAGMSIQSRVPEQLLKFYDDFPSSQLNGNPLTRWAILANTPLAQSTKEAIYPVIKREIEGLTQQNAVEKILNMVQTGFTYGYDDQVWGHDRPFFSEETLFYPFSDCEDRAILFSRLVRDLVGIDVALLYYPNHLATAVCFPEDVAGDAVRIDGRKFTICDPTYIGAPVGTQMPSLKNATTQSILLRK